MMWGRREDWGLGGLSSDVLVFLTDQSPGHLFIPQHLQRIRLGQSWSEIDNLAKASSLVP